MFANFWILYISNEMVRFNEMLAIVRIITELPKSGTKMDVYIEDTCYTIDYIVNGSK